MYVYEDADEWEWIYESGGTPPYTGWAHMSRRRRPAVEVARIKAERRQKEEDEILRQADEIRASREGVSYVAEFGGVPR